MSRPRYVVQTVTGHRMTMQSSGGSNSRLGLSAHVCDTIHQYAVVATYRSEFRRSGDNNAAALRDAEAHAERLNRGTA